MNWNIISKISSFIRYRCKAVIALTLLIIMSAACVSGGNVFAADGDFSPVTPTKNITVENDDGKGTSYKKLPANYVQLTNLNLSRAVIVSGDGYSIIQGQAGSTAKSTQPLLVWTGKVKFGGAKRTNTSNAVTKYTGLPAVTIKLPNSAKLSDGRSADLVITLDQVAVNLTKSFNDKISDNTNVKVLMMRSDCSLAVTSPKTSFSVWNNTAANTNSGAGVGQKMRVTMKITEHKDGKTVGNVISASDYPSMLILFKDLDVYDKLMKKNASWTDKYNGTFAEGIEMISGWGSPVVLAHNGSNIFNQCLVNKQTVNTNNLKIKGNGTQYGKVYDKTGDTNDEDSYYSGFAAAVKPQGFTFNWYGCIIGGEESTSSMGTHITSQPTVAVWSKRGEGGSLRNSDLNAWKKNTHLMNSAAEYDYKPDEGYIVKSLKVDGVSQNLTEDQKLHGGKYTFTRLNKNPVPGRSYSNGNILEASASSHYEIEAEFEKAPVRTSDLILSKNVTGNLGDKTKEFEFTLSLSGLGKSAEYEAVSGDALIDDQKSYDSGRKKLISDADGNSSLNVRLKDDTSLRINGLPEGCKFTISEVSSDHAPSYTIRTEGSDKDIAAGSSESGHALATEVITMEGDKVYTAAFVNNRKLAVVTGIADDSGIPAAATASAIAAALAAAVIFLRGALRNSGRKRS